MNITNIMLQQFSNNPMFRMAQQMGQGKSKAEIEQIAKNLCAEKGLNYDEVYSAFQNQIMKGLK